MKRLIVAGVVVVAAGFCLAAAAQGEGVKHGFMASSSGRGTPGYLGISVKGVSDERVAALKLKDTKGVEISAVDHDGPAGKMGLRLHDVVLQMNGTPVDGEDHMRRMLHDLGPGKTVTLMIVREGQSPMTVTAQMSERGEVERQAFQTHISGGVPAGGGPQAPAFALPAGPGDEDAVAPGAAGPPVSGGRYSRGFIGTLLMSPSYTGVILEKMGPQLAMFFGSQNGAGLLVRSVEPRSPAAEAGLMAGDVVIRANAQMVASMGDWAKQIKEAKGHPVQVVVLREKAEHTLTLVPDGKKRSSVEKRDGDETVLARLADVMRR